MPACWEVGSSGRIVIRCYGERDDGCLFVV